MLSYSDPKWNELKGGYHVQYNPVPILKKLENDDEPQQCWDELWQELYHQGDVGEASYAALIKLIDIKARHPRLSPNLYSFVLAVELARQEPHNPSVPDWLSADYNDALDQAYRLALKEIERTTGEAIYDVLGVVALHKKQYTLAQLLLESDETVLKEYFESR